jgi:tetratricopeptide (TPR) repeat protein
MRRALVYVLLSLAAAGAAVGSESERARGLAALDRGDAASARPLLLRDAAESAYWLAVAERGVEGKVAAERAAALATGVGGWLEPASRGLVAAAAQKLPEAVAAFREATAAGAEPRVWKQLGDLLVASDDRAGARAAFDQAVTLAPDYPAALVALGDLQREAGDFGAAFNSFNHAVGADGLPISALLGRAAARLYMGDRDGTAGDLERAITLAEPGFDLYRALMGVVYLSAYERRLPQGLDRAERAVAMWQGLGRADMAAAAANATARVLLETGDADSAEAWYRRGGEIVAASSLAGDQRTIWRVRELHGLARSAALRREVERANQLAAEAQSLMESDPANSEHYQWIGPYLFGYLRIAERRYDEAIEELQKSDTERAHIRLLIADAYARKRDKTNARLWYERALAASTGLDPESVVARPAARAWLDKNR